MESKDKSLAEESIPHGQPVLFNYENEDLEG